MRIEPLSKMRKSVWFPDLMPSENLGSSHKAVLIENRNENGRRFSASGWGPPNTGLVPTRRSMEETSYQEKDLGWGRPSKKVDNKTCFSLLVCILCKGLISWPTCFDCVTKEACVGTSVGRSKIPQIKCPMACIALHNLHLIVACLQVPSISHFQIKLYFDHYRATQLFLPWVCTWYENCAAIFSSLSHLHGP